MILSDLSIRRPIMMSMLLIVFILFGGMAYFGMPLDLMADIDVPYVVVQTVYQGAGPKEIETQITKRVEDAVASISKIDQLTSYSMEGISIVILKFDLDKDVDVANQEVTSKIDAILGDLPDDSDPPTVEKIDLQEFPIIEVILSGSQTSTELYDIADTKLKDRFSQVEGVARTEVSGGQQREIQVLLDGRAVTENSISLSRVAAIIGAHNLDMPGGHFKRRTQEYTVRMTGEYESIEELENVEIPTVSGSKRLKDIAEVSDAGAEVRERTMYFNNIEKVSNPDAVMLSVVKSSEGNTVDIAHEITDMLPGIEESLPAGCTLDIVTNKATFIEDTVNDTIQTIILGIILTGLVLLFFLHDFRSTIIVALAMPMSIISAFMLMNMLGFTKNIMTLMGLSTSVGILVSNSVVVLENIFRLKREGKNRKEAASAGTSGVVVAVVAATATNIAVFVPVANMSGMMGQVFYEFAMTVTFATLFSLLISFTLTPMMASLILPESNVNKKRPISEKAEAFFGKMESGYKNLLRTIMANRKRSAGIIVAALVILAGTMMFAGGIGFEFMPIMDEGDIRIEVELPTSANIEETAVALQTIEDRLKHYPSVKRMVTEVGSLSEMDLGVFLATISVKLVDPGERDLTTNATTAVLIEDLSDIPNVKIRVRAVSSMDMGGQAPITFYLQGQDIDRVEAYKEEILRRISDVPGLVNLTTSSRPGVPEISIKPDRKAIADAGLTVYDVAMQMRGAMAGLVATQYRDEGEEYDLRIMIADDDIDTPEEVANLPVFSNGQRYTLSQLGEIGFAEGLSKILHIDKFKAVQFSASTAPGVALGDVMAEIDLRTADLNMPSGYVISYGGTSEIMNDAIVDMATALLIAIVLTYMLLAAILENLTQPLLVLGTFPLALVGVLGALLMTGITMNVISMMSIVMLLGIVVNNAILILDYANELVKNSGMDIRRALLEAAPVKLRAILMSSSAIILGMVPMALGMGASGREIRESMGIVTIGGLLVSTVLTLFVIPALYNLVARSQTKSVEVK